MRIVEGGSVVGRIVLISTHIHPTTHTQTSRPINHTHTKTRFHTYLAPPRLPRQFHPDRRRRRRGPSARPFRGPGHAHAHAEVDEADVAAGVAHEVLEAHVAGMVWCGCCGGVWRVGLVVCGGGCLPHPRHAHPTINTYMTQYVPVRDPVAALHVEQAQGNLPDDGGGLGLADALAVGLHLLGWFYVLGLVGRSVVVSGVDWCSLVVIPAFPSSTTHNGQAHT